MKVRVHRDLNIEIFFFWKIVVERWPAHDDIKSWKGEPKKKGLRRVGATCFSWPMIAARVTAFMTSVWPDRSLSGRGIEGSNAPSEGNRFDGLSLSDPS